jgi:hypothetical protein
MLFVNRLTGATLNLICDTITYAKSVIWVGRRIQEIQKIKKKKKRKDVFCLAQFSLADQFIVKAACADSTELATAIPTPPTTRAPIIASIFLVFICLTHSSLVSW